jgi:hypothetical protein
MFPSSEAPRLAVGLTKALSQCCFLWCQDRPLFSADAKIQWRHSSAPPYDFVVSSDKFNFTFISACSFGNKKVLKEQVFDSHCYNL